MTIATETVASGLLIPEGPVALADGSVLLVEVAAGRLDRVTPDGRVEVVADLGGGPNGAAIGPDGLVYVCNNGGGATCALIDGVAHVSLDPARYVGGSIQVVDLADVRHRTLYRECDGIPLHGPNDIVFDAVGGFWFTDFGRPTGDGQIFGGLFYAHADGRHIQRARRGLLSPNGIGLSPDGSRLYWTDTHTARLWRCSMRAPGILADDDRVVQTLPGYRMLDSIAVEANGQVCAGTIIEGGITVFDPAAGTSEHVAIDDPMVTNICFAGPDRRIAWITGAGTGRLLRAEWPRPGLPLAFEA
jgi:gluconolactonase